MNLSTLSHFSSKKQYFTGIGILGFTSVVCFLFSAYISAQVVAFILLLVLSFIAMFFDILPVLVCSLISALIWGFIFMPPFFSFEVEKTEDIITLCMYFLISLVSATLTYKIRRMEKVIIEKEKRTEAVKLHNTILHSLSHEFRTPISAVIAAADNLLNDDNRLNAGDKKNMIEEISIAALRLNRHVENLLNMSRIDSGFIELKKNWCDLKEIICNTIAQLDAQKEDHTINVEVSDELPLFKLDYVLMEQVFFNLINNALLYTPKKTIINIDANYRNGYLNIFVADNGNGFPETELKKVFDKFYRINKFIPGGTGLGLSIVKGFVEAHSGTIELRNRSNGGAEFLIKIPTETLNFDQQDNEKKFHSYN